MPKSPQSDGRGGLRRRSSLLSNDIAAARAAVVQQQVQGGGRVESAGGSGGSPTIPEQQARFCTRFLCIESIGSKATMLCSGVRRPLRQCLTRTHVVAQFSQGVASESHHHATTCVCTVALVFVTEC